MRTLLQEAQEATSLFRFAATHSNIPSSCSSNTISITTQHNTIHTQIAPVIPSSPVSLPPRSQSAFHSTPVTSDISVRRRYSDYSNTGPIGGIPSMPQGMLSADFSALAEVGFSGSSSWLIPPHQPGFDPASFLNNFSIREFLRSPPKRVRLQWHKQCIQ
ncbi:hypothetical protein BCR33DRAFT_762561, partial [Rhizoclosmatium globosum]